MEIALLPKSGLRIKGKFATIAVDPQDKFPYAAALLIEKTPGQITPQENMILISGVGEFEIGSIKMSGMRSEGDMIYSIIVDNVEILIGKLNSLEKMQNKLKEHKIIIVLCNEVGNASFITSLAESVVMFYGEKAVEIASSFGKENVKQMNKFSSTKDKLPAEVETILLQ